MSGGERSFLFLFLGKEEEDVRIASRRRGLAPAGPASVGPSYRWTTPFFFRYRFPLSFPVHRRRFPACPPLRRRQFFAPALLRPFSHYRRHHPYPVAADHPLPQLPVRLAATSSPAPSKRPSLPVRRLEFKIPTRYYYRAADRLRANSHFHSQMRTLPASTLSCQSDDRSSLPRGTRVCTTLR